MPSVVSTRRRQRNARNHIRLLPDRGLPSAALPALFELCGDKSRFLIPVTDGLGT